MTHKFIGLLSIIFFAACGLIDPEQRIFSTTTEIVETLKLNNAKKYSWYLALDLKSMGKNEEMLISDVVVMSRLVKAGRGAKVKVTDDHNELGQRRVILELDTLVIHGGIRVKPHIVLLFGPSSVSDYNKISGYGIKYDNLDDWEFSYDENMNSKLKKF